MCLMMRSEGAEALQSAQTELEFENGIIAREKTDPNKIVVFNSAGLGISSDGGQTFRTAMTGAGFVAEEIVGGSIIGVNLSSQNEEGTFQVNGSNAEFIDIGTGRNVKISPDGLFGYNSNGDVRFRADKLLVTSAALGTNNSNVYLAPDSNNEVRVVDVNSIPSDGVAENYSYRPIRALGYSFGPGANGYIGTDGELRVTSIGFKQEDGSVIYRDVRAGSYFGTGFITSTTNAYIGTDDELRVVSKGGAASPGTGNLIYRNVKANGFHGQFLTADPDLYAYIGSDLGLRVTSRGLAGAGPIYRDVTAAFFSNGSKIESKTDIHPWEEDALSLINNADIATYFLKGDIEQEERSGNTV